LLPNINANENAFDISPLKSNYLTKTKLNNKIQNGTLYMPFLLYPKTIKKQKKVKTMK